MKVSRVVLSFVLLACSVLSFSCGSDSDCQSTGLACAKTGTIVWACCDVGHTIGDISQGQCKYVSDDPAHPQGTPQTYQCEGVDCGKAEQAMTAFCAASP